MASEPLLAVFDVTAVPRWESAAVGGAGLACLPVHRLIVPIGSRGFHGTSATRLRQFLEPRHNVTYFWMTPQAMRAPELPAGSVL